MHACPLCPTVAQLIEQYRGLVELVEPASVTPVVTSDPDDDQVLATALAAQADLIVSRDDDLRRLGGYRGIQIVSAAEALRRVGDESGG
jgi:predicted nucleic acid-binding protein